MKKLMIAVIATVFAAGAFAQDVGGQPHHPHHKRHAHNHHHHAHG